MRIKQQLALMIGIPILGLLVVGAIEFYTDHQLEAFDVRRDVADEIIIAVAELQFLSTDYLIHREPRAAEQWRQRHRSLGLLLRNFHARVSQEAETVGRIRRSHAALAELFTRLAVVSGDERPMAEKVVAHVIDNILSASASMMASASRLAKSSAVNAELLTVAMHRWRVSLGFIALVISAIAMALIGRNLVHPISALRRSVARVRSGEYATVTGLRRRDEFGDLARAFDEMTAELRDETARRGRIERQLQEGKQALQAQTEALERSNAELQQFAYVASHDLQEPLRTVRSYTQLLQERYAERLDQDGREFLQFVVDGTSRMQRLIQDLLSYSRVTRSAPELQPVDMSGVMESVSKSLGRLIEDAGADVDVDVLPSVSGDPGQLAQVLQNLVSNALKFRAADRRPRVQVRAVRKDRFWEIRVSDNGIGIEPRHAERIFEPFRRLHAVGRYPGSGIGLALCRKLIARHGGKIWVESQAEGGSCFCFTLVAVDYREAVSEDAA